MPFRPTRWLAPLIALWLGGFAVSPVSAVEAERPFSPAGLTIHLLVTDPAAPGTVYLSVASGLFKSMDSGRTWSWSGRGLGRDVLGALVSDPSRPGTLYALSSGSSANLFGSTDGGTSWRPLDAPPLKDVHSWGRGLAIDGAGTVYAAIGHVVVATSDRGATWIPLQDFEAPIQSLAIHPTAPGTLYVATSAMGGGVSIPAQIHRSEDGGHTWRKMGGDVLSPDLGKRMGFGTVFLAVTNTRPETVYAGVAGEGIYRSTDGGVSWRRLALGRPGEYLPLQGLIVDRADPATLYTALDGASSREPGSVAVSHDGGTTWRNRDGLSFSFLAAGFLAVDSSTGALFAASTAGNLQVSTEKQPWRSLLRRRAGGSFPQKGKVRFRPGDPSTVSTLLAGQYWNSTDGGKSWTERSAAPGSPFLNDLAFDAADPNLLYGAAETGVFRSSDGGESWTLLHGTAAEALVLPRPGTILAGGCGIARSTDGGKTWQEVLPCQGSSPSDRREVKSLRVHAAAPDEVLATVHGIDGQGVRPRSVYRSRDGGATWALVAGASLAIHDNLHPGALYAVKGNDLAKTDDGETWTTIGSLAQVGELSDLVVDPARPDRLHGVAHSGLARSRDGGRTWGLEWFQFPVVNASTLVPHPTVPHLLYVGGSNGIYEVRLEPEEALEPTHRRQQTHNPVQRTGLRPAAERRNVRRLRR